MTTIGKLLFCATLTLTSVIAWAPGGALAQGGSPGAAPKYSPEVPAGITTPDTIETRIGTLRFQDGAPDSATVRSVYDQLDFGRGIDAFLWGMSATSIYAGCRGLEDAGVKANRGIAITEDLLDARTLFLTPNTTTRFVLLLHALAQNCVRGVSLREAPV